MKVATYTIAVGDYYVGLASRCACISKHFNPQLSFTIYCYGTTLMERMQKVLSPLGISLKWIFGFGEIDRWTVNFKKWEVDLESIRGDYTHYLWLDADAFILGRLTDEIIQRDLKTEFGVCIEPTAAKLVKRLAHWTTNGTAAYFTPVKYRHTYYNAGVVLTTTEGMRFFRNWISQKRKKDEEEGLFKTSPYFDETYLNRFVLVEHPNRITTLPPYWDQFAVIRNPNTFNICHMVGYGAKSGYTWMNECVAYIMKKYNIKDPVPQLHEKA